MTRKLVLLRHGQSQWNLDNRFTGWVDVDLTEQGRREAAAAGRLMREEGLQFDVAHTSVLKRAIHTLQGALAELEQDWLPVNKSWRLNERHYGGLQGLDKAETAAKHGEEQVKVWRRSYDIPPPPMELEDPGHRSMTAATPAWTATRCRAPNRWPPPWIACCRTGTTRSRRS